MTIGEFRSNIKEIERLASIIGEEQVIELGYRQVDEYLMGRTCISLSFFREFKKYILKQGGSYTVVTRVTQMRREAADKIEAILSNIPSEYIPESVYIREAVYGRKGEPTVRDLRIPVESGGKNLHDFLVDFVKAPVGEDEKYLLFKKYFFYIVVPAGRNLLRIISEKDWEKIRKDFPEMTERLLSEGAAIYDNTERGKAEKEIERINEELEATINKMSEEEKSEGMCIVDIRSNTGIDIMDIKDER